MFRIYEAKKTHCGTKNFLNLSKTLSSPRFLRYIDKVENKVEDIGLFFVIIIFIDANNLHLPFNQYSFIDNISQLLRSGPSSFLHVKIEMSHFLERTFTPTFCSTLSIANEPEQYFDYHWRSFWRFCKPCDIRYGPILKLVQLFKNAAL